MKFRNPETGEVHSEIWPLLNPYCVKHECDKCGLPFNCVEFVRNHPVEAARLMGYEVVEDEKRLVEHQDKETGDLYYTVEKEANMDKPRICEVLGVEVGERFELGNTGIILLVNDDGLLHISLSHGGHKETDMNVNYLVKAINDPDRIIRKPRFTEQEVKKAKAVKAIWPDAKRIEHPNTSLYVYSGVNFLTKLPESTFPSIQQGQTCNIEDIIDAEKD